MFLLGSAATIRQAKEATAPTSEVTRPTIDKHTPLQPIRRGMSEWYSLIVGQTVFTQIAGKSCLSSDLVHNQHLTTL